jgi:hypothetical protein
MKESDQAKAEIIAKPDAAGSEENPELALWKNN